MIRSLYSGVSGMKNHQIRMDTVGNNIANVNTVGFKGGRVNFQDTLYQTLQYGGDSKNFAQVGAGVSLASIYNDFGQGSMQSTGRTLDLAIDGKGFFVVSNDSDFDTSVDSTTGAVTGGGTVAFDSATSEKAFTRNGVFFIDKDGSVVDSNGNKLLGYDKDNDEYIPIQIHTKDSSGNDLTIESLSIGKDGKITGTYTNGDPVEFVTTTNTSYGTSSKEEMKVAIGSFANDEGLEKIGSNLYSEAPLVSGEASYGVATDSIKINSGYLEMSNVDLTEEFTNMITTQRGYQANSRVITTSDRMLEELINLKR